MHRLTERELQSLRNLGNECEAAADRIEHLERVLMQAKEAMIVLHSGPFGVKSGASVHAIAAIDEALHSEVIEKR